LCVGLAPDREQRDVELGNEADDVEPETDPGADGAEHGRKRQVVGVRPFMAQALRKRMCAKQMLPQVKKLDSRRWTAAR